jgi:hypothetical protein
MRRVLFMAAIMLMGCNAGLAQVSTMGTTAMGLSSTPGAIVTSPLNGPGPFSATTSPGAPDTTLAPVPLASDPATPGTVVTCSTPAGQIAPGTPAVTVTSMPVVSSTTGAMPAASAVSTTPAVSAAISATITGNAIAPYLTLSAQPATSSTTDIFGSTIPAPQLPTVPALPPPSITIPSVPTQSTVSGTMSTSMAAAPAAMTPPIMAMSSTPLGSIPTSIIGSTTGTISPTSPLGSSSVTVCSTMPGGPPTNGAALPLTTPQIPANPPPGTIQQDITQPGATSIAPTMVVMPTPNTSACAESMTMNLATPGTMAANATGAAATPGVSPPGC